MYTQGMEQASEASGGWFVYLFALSDCSAFKVGFTCNPLQRIFGFSRRYFERFDLQQSELLRLVDCDSARELETRLKRGLADFRCDAPKWLPAAAGGHTEWFGAVYFSDAREELHACANASGTHCLNAFDLLRAELSQRSHEFELWAAQRANQWEQVYVQPRSAEKAAAALRDWLDAYHYCGIPLFVDDRALRLHVQAAAGR